MKTEREKAILEIAIREKQVNVKKLAKELYASESSIRRDLNRLEKQNLLKRIHGGAILDENAISSIKIPFLIRELEKSDEKTQIAKKAALLIRDGNVVFLDASTSAYNIIPYLANKKNLIVITNGLKALAKLAEYNINCIGTGGSVMNSCLAFVGEATYKVIESY
ncbi:MAG: DeoR/GlpR transcriptional regulator, partial [Firmicutes bacterium]|nr:DeoR/GlpR transcriptional regulator [Bacillota bacterium]